MGSTPGWLETFPSSSRAAGAVKRPADRDGVILRTGQEKAQACADEIAEELACEPSVRIACAVWRDHDAVASV